ncbi:hypothetical protein T12_3567 [Trichinella patagoniensis]|uniref:Uncharacterized protein n=1 Tax=Trichinella patagoniensis TaxID=990121 RepID=A0A0V0Z705_9BILA|nr:hypothetical protein T12_3567 [Trichinella patagoniensis]
MVTLLLSYKSTKERSGLAKNSNWVQSVPHLTCERDLRIIYILFYEDLLFMRIFSSNFLLVKL